jgi:L-ascorbate metabolism protein UlaG (beta-lactamase superfamily)
VTGSLRQLPFVEPLPQRLNGPPRSELTLYWLGQAGFAIEAGGRRILIDPYLSNSLASKYQGSRFSHERMTAPPAMAEEIGVVDLVLCTHHHTDHMDAATLAPLARRWPSLRFCVPTASAKLAEERIGCGERRLIAMDAGDSVKPFPGLSVHATRAAHETIERDELQKCRFLGYALKILGATIFHSGDCVPFEGQISEVSALAPDLALLPVNGRSAALAEAGFAGNFYVEEAIALCDHCGIPAMIAHHYGLFAFNTAEPGALDSALTKAGLAATRARDQIAYTLSIA